MISKLFRKSDNKTNSTLDCTIVRIIVKTLSLASPDKSIHISEGLKIFDRTSSKLLICLKPFAVKGIPVLSAIIFLITCGNDARTSGEKLSMILEAPGKFGFSGIVSKSSNESKSSAFN